jgi:acyl-CoA thioesterase-1
MQELKYRMGNILPARYPIALLLLLLVIGSGCGNKEKAKASSKTNVSQPENQKQDTANGNMKSILFFGNSLTAGYGVEPSEAFPALIQSKIDSMHLPYKVINAGLSGETSAGGKNRIDWVLNQPVDIFFLELGGNDGLRGIPVKETEKNLQIIIDKVAAKYPQAQLVLVGMLIPPSMGATYANDFKNVFRRLADKNKLRFLPFLLEGVGGVAELNQPDGIHPTARGHKIVAETVWNVLKDVPGFLTAEK